MSRRGRHGRHPHQPRPGRPEERAGQPRTDAPAGSLPEAPAEPAIVGDQPPVIVPLPPVAEAGPEAAPDDAALHLRPLPDSVERAHVRPRPERTNGGATAEPAPMPAAATPGDDGSRGAPVGIAERTTDGVDRRPACTAAQLRRFIKSRPWVPMHELRRRFGINGADDEVTGITVGELRVFVGLPQAEGRVLAELLSGGDVGYELSVDPWTPIVIGVYPMRPVPRA